MQSARSTVETLGLRLVVRILRKLGPVRSSDWLGAFARTIGPHLPVSCIADVNLRLAFPELDAGERRGVLLAAWENLGRTMGEFPHIGRLQQVPNGPGWEIVGAETLQAVAAQGGPAIFFSGHIGNWEMLPAACAAYGVPFSPMFRAANNPDVAALVTALRRDAIGVPVPMFAKGPEGARKALAHLRQGGFLGLLVDQKLNDGLEATLFGHKTFTTTALAVLALHLRCPVIPGHVQRLGSARLRLVCEPPMQLPDKGNRRTDIEATVQAMNGYLERWIRERPDSWLWMHRRWPKPFYARSSK